MARVSQIASPSTSSVGTFPDGEWRRIFAFESGWRSLTPISRKAMPAYRMASHGRRLQLDMFLSPITS